jgi:glycosyltransferase involved in cell wall biosynthesis
MIAPTSFFADYGCHVRILEEARILQKLGHRVTIVTYHNGGPVAGLEIRRTPPIPWRRDYEVGSSRHKIGFDLLLVIRALPLLLLHRPDVIHAHLHEGALIAKVLGSLFGIPVVFDMQGSMTGEMLDHGFIGKRDSLGYRIFHRLETWLDRHSSLILTSSTHAEQLLLREFGCRPERVRALPDCVNAETFLPASAYPSETLAQLRERLGVPAGRKVIVYLGLLAEYQGTGLLLEAVQRLVATRPDTHLLLMGFPGVERYRAKAIDLGIADHVTLTGRVPYEDAPIHLALGDVAAAPKMSLTEGSGKILDYMAAGIPVVAFDTPVAREYLGCEGVLVPVGDVAGLASALERCLYPSPSDAGGVASMGARLRLRALSNFAWERAGAVILDGYTQVMGERSAARQTANALLEHR